MRLFRSGMLDVVHMWNDEVEVFYNAQIVNQKRIYSQRFATASHVASIRVIFHSCSLSPRALKISQVCFEIVRTGPPSFSGGQGICG